ncbi:phosphate ABC transporter substrate-binding protein, PhoT family [Salinihabitans flavidus]|uniref:Phosphate ABC transporter substrate-binding protein, PhoT family n=1 Tax=Salinihabitans flavidus TaxID=569882 RepID=A0A1H8LV00_9RHOB|nr:phosphate ABC transporter substrate-binding/OmpA family protein [Salinihabitans flavidus]SEO08919.1 phosphate ABC transporter substrate-binding protein, PhoT family [Salinihabitans flavidus]
MVQLRAAFRAALFLCFTGLYSQAVAQDITLTSYDGAVEISGTLLGFDGQFYRVETIYGELTVDGTGVRCEGPACPSLLDYVAEIRISGSAGMAEVLLPALVEAFALRNQYGVTRVSKEARRFEYHLSDRETGKLLVKFLIHASNADEGFADLLANEADIVMSLREIREKEATRGYEAGLGDLTDPRRSHVLALDGLVPVVAPGNPVRDISPGTLARVFAGEIDSWKILGGPDAPIDLHLLTRKSGLTQAVEDQLMQPAELSLSSQIKRHETPDDLISAVSRAPFAIGMSAFSNTGAARVLDLSGGCGFTLSAARRSIKTEDYPLTAPMFLYLPARRLPKLARAFLSYAVGPAAQIVIRRAGFVDQTPEEVPVTLQGDRFINAISAAGEEISLRELQSMVKLLAPRDRLTTSFRFEAGSARLDAQSRSNVLLLARGLEAGTYDEREILFVGFSDGLGRATGNREIAQKRAEAVRKAVLEAAEAVDRELLSTQVAAFGEAMPMACDDSAWGRQVNRRVEVWLR